jgi:Leucine-rich repeat (LRR) protein
MPRLTTLALDGNSIDSLPSPSEDPDEDETSDENAKKNGRNVSSITYFPSLESLSFARNRVTRIPPRLGRVNV